MQTDVEINTVNVIHLSVASNSGDAFAPPININVNKHNATNPLKQENPIVKIVGDMPTLQLNYA